MAMTTAPEAPTRTPAERGVSLARGPALIVGTILLAAGLYFLYREHNFPPFSNFPNGSAPVPGKAFFGIFGVNGWSGMLTAVAGGLLLFGAGQHLLAKTMSLIVGAALGAAAIIAAISGNVLGMAAANVWTELLWGVAAAILLLNSLMPRRGRTVAEDRPSVVTAPVADRQPAAVAAVDDRPGAVAERPLDDRSGAAAERPLDDRSGAVAERPVSERAGGAPMPPPPASTEQGDLVAPTEAQSGEPVGPTQIEPREPVARSRERVADQPETRPGADEANLPTSGEPGSRRYDDTPPAEESPALGATGDPVLGGIDDTPPADGEAPPRGGLFSRLTKR